MATNVWEGLARSGRGIRLLNHPMRAMRRFELSRTLHHLGINPFNVFRYPDFKEITRWPVFLRVDGDHGGARSELLENRAALAREFNRAYKYGIDPGEMLAVEFCDTSDAEGIFRKYGACVIAGEAIGTHIKFSRKWHIKSSDLYTEELQAEELAFVKGNPWRDQLVAIAARARIDYGRFDFSVVDRKVVVWEINNNPQVQGRGVDRPERQPAMRASLPRVEDALRRLSLPAAATR